MQTASADLPGPYPFVGRGGETTAQPFSFASLCGNNSFCKKPLEEMLLRAVLAALAIAATVNALCQRTHALAKYPSQFDACAPRHGRAVSPHTLQPRGSVPP